MRFALALMFLVVVSARASAETTFHDQHVIFENSSAGDCYYHSSVKVVAPSQIELLKGKLPVGTERFISPPNCLRLKWRSASGGDWRVQVLLPERFGAERKLAGDTLCMWVYTPEEITQAASPLLVLQDRQGNSVPDVPLLAEGALPADQWVQLRLPLKRFASQYQGTVESGFQIDRLASITLAQGLDDGQDHELLIDDVRLVDGDVSDSQAPAAPGGLVVEPYEQHCELSWQACADADLVSYRIYRSTDGSTFTPVDTRPGYSTRCVDFVGGPGKTVHYKISAVDLVGNESSLSAPTHETTKPLDDDALLDMVQRGCFRYYWEAAEPNSGMALEVLPGDDQLVALGGSGFGISAFVAAVERGFITRDAGVARLQQILRFLERADRFHGVWPHFLDGRTGRVWPLFGKYDNGGDLVETAFLMQGLLTARQYFDRDTQPERDIRETITRLWEEVEWDWYRKTPDGEVLYWHWSPEYGWHISHPLVGWNETMIVYLLAVASPTHPVPASLYSTGWAGQSEPAVNYRRGWSRTTDGDHYTNGHEYYGHKLPVGCGTGGDLFFAQFSFLGFDPRGIKDPFANYFHNNRQLALINRAYCIANPWQHAGYGPNCWGLSAGVHSGGGKPEPRNDNGTICCSAALGCFPYTPEESMSALKHFYRSLGDKVWGVYGFHDGFNQTDNWFDESHMALNQAQIVVGIENHRSGLAWKCFMANPEIQPMLAKIGFVPDSQGSAPAAPGSADARPEQAETQQK